MPAGDGLQLALNSGVGVGVIAGLFSGACFLLIQGYKRLRQNDPPLRCYICNQLFPAKTSSENITCSECGRTVCRANQSEQRPAVPDCSQWDPNERKWKCFLCSCNFGAKPSLIEKIRNWEENAGHNTMTERSYKEQKNTDIPDDYRVAAKWERKRQQIRQVIEGRAGLMVGGGLDEVNVGRLYAHAHYERMFKNHHADLSTALARLANALHSSSANNLPPISRLSKADIENYQTPDNNITVAELGLREAVRRVAKEATKLPFLGGVTPSLGVDGDEDARSHSSVRGDIDSTYEDLLATAILNKVIDKYQKNVTNQRPHSPNGSISSRHSSCARSNIGYSTNNVLDEIDEYVPENHHDYRQNYRKQQLYSRTESPYSSLRYRDGVHQLGEDDFQVHSEPHAANTKITENYRRVKKNKQKKNSGGDLETASMSSLDDFSGGSSSSKHRDEMSLTIQQCIEEETSSENEYDHHADSSDYSDLNTLNKNRNHVKSFQRDFHIDSMNHQIDSHIEIENEDDEYDDDTAQDTETWEENWLFQKKKMKSSIISTPVAMLVPNPNTEYRALIGDRDVEDTTDLSEAGSDFEQEYEQTNGDLKSILVKSKTIIGGKNDFGIVEELVDDDIVNVYIEMETKPKDRDVNQEFIAEENKTEAIQNGDVKQTTNETNNDTEIDEIENDKIAFNIDTTSSHVKSRAQKWDNFIERNTNANKFTNLTPDSNKHNDRDNSKVRAEVIIIDSGHGSLNETRNTALADNTFSETDSVDSGPQKDRDYTEKYATIGRKHIEGLIPAPRKSMENGHKNDYEADSGIDITDAPPRKGTIAEREHLKWQNAAPIPNNPYSAENIKKRLSQRSTSCSVLPFINKLEPSTNGLENGHKTDEKVSTNSQNTDISASTPHLDKIDDNDDHVFVKSTSVLDVPRIDRNKPDKWEQRYGSRFGFDASEELPPSLSPDNWRAENDSLNPAEEILFNALYESNSEKAKSSPNLIDLSPIGRDSNSNRSNSRLSNASSTPSRNSLQDVFAADIDYSENKRYGRDYYIKEAKRASGARRINSPMDSPISSPLGSLSYDSINNNDQENSKIEEKVAPPTKKITNSMIYHATPLRIIEDDNNKMANIINMTSPDIELISLGSSGESYGTPNSSLENMHRVYNIGSQKIIYQAPSPAVPLKNEIVTLAEEEPTPIKVRASPLAFIEQNLIDQTIENKQITEELKTSQKNVKSDVVTQQVERENKTPENKDENQNSVHKNNYEKEEFTISRAESPESSSSMSNDVEIFYKMDETDGKEKSKKDDENEDKMLSVQELKKKFSSQSDEHKVKQDKKSALHKMTQPVHSLTARSLSKQFREGLKNSQIEPNTAKKFPICEHDKPSGRPERFEEDTIIISPEDSLKKRLEFFEQLNKQR